MSSLLCSILSAVWEFGHQKAARSTNTHEGSSTIGNATVSNYIVRPTSIRRARKHEASVLRNNVISFLYTLLGIMGMGMILWSWHRIEKRGLQQLEVPQKQAPLVLTMRWNNPHVAEPNRREPMAKVGRAHPPGEGDRYSFVGDRSPKFLAIQKNFQDIYPENQTARQR